MSDLTITCDRCSAEVSHRCNADIVQAIVDLFTWGPEHGMPDYMIKEGKRAKMYGKGDEDAPFMTEAFLYTALGKEDARTLLALVNHVVAAAGLDQMGIYKAVNARMEAIKVEREARVTQQRRQQLVHYITAKGLDVEEAEWPLLQHLERLNPRYNRYRISEPFKKSGKQWRTYTRIEVKEPA